MTETRPSANDSVSRVPGVLVGLATVVVAGIFRCETALEAR